tara:strand:+ start:1434 stop:2615 length:1182 start_codon:yes stop_codon:yes gene_type:complete
MAQTKVKSELIDGGLGTDWQSTIQTSNFTAAAGKGYFVNTTSGEITVTLPAGVVGEEIILQDYAGTFDTNNIIIASNGSEKIQGRTSDAKCIIESATINLVYQDATKGWTADNIVDNPPTRTVNFLVVAGGGGVGRTDSYYGGGGGAGGFRSSTDGRGGGQSSDTALQLDQSTNYTVTVGAGGAEATSNSGSAAKGTTGSDSVFATITSKGGGGAGGNDATGDGKDGGSGGGAGGNDQDNTGGHAVTSPVVHGYDGGDDVGTGNSVGGAGGGGAGSVGANVAGTAGANGGAAKAATITGSTVYYAAGGGGKRGWTGSHGSAGSNAVGGANSGDGGNGANYGNNAANGQSGKVIVKYGNSYTLTIGAGLTSSTATSGSYKITSFTAGTGTISIN